MKDKKNQDN